MTAGDSGLERERLARARALLHPPAPRKARNWPALVAAAFMAICALALAASMLIAPSFHNATELPVEGEGE